MKRRTFMTSLLAAQSPAPPAGSFYLDLVRANDDAVQTAARGRGIRGVGTQLETLVAAFCAPESKYHSSAALIAPMEQASERLLRAQHADGTIDSGNLNSPPDTGFVLESACAALAVLRQVADARVDTVRNNLGKFILAAAEAQVTGGVHTPNHRWVICAALARIHSLFPSPRWVARIDDWLGEGVFIDADGQYSERSTGIYSRVVDRAMVTMARLLHRPALLDPVRRNLEMTVYYMHPDGEMETVGSRRQDQSIGGSIATYYPEYRYLAIRDNNRLFAAVASHIERAQAERVKRTNPLIGFLEEPLLRQKLPPPGEIPSSYAKVFPASGIARIRRGDVSATVYGGSDWPLGIASGLASNPTFFTFRKGKAVLESVRMGAQFFSEGAFRSQGLVVDGGRYMLHQRFEVPYYQPLAKADRNRRGDYALTPAADERFWSKMNFPRRRVSNVQTLDQKVTVTESGGAFELHFEITGHDGVPVTIELAFRPGGTFEGTAGAFLKEGLGRYRVGTESIEFGPGQADHEFLNLAGSSYIAHGAALKANGACVYITGFTPFRKVLRIG